MEIDKIWHNGKKYIKFLEKYNFELQEWKKYKKMQKSVDRKNKTC